MPADSTNLALRAAPPGEVIELETPEQLRAEIERLHSVVALQDTRMACIQDIGQALSSATSLDALLQVIMEKITVLMDADRSTLFLLNPAEGVLWSQVLQGGQINEIRLNIGEGIAGWVAQTGRSVNIPDAYTHERFNASVDLRTGYQTRTILCQPIRNQKRDIIGVVQVLNKLDGAFTAEDETLLSAIAAQVAISLENYTLYAEALARTEELTDTQERLEQKLAEFDLLLTIQREIAQAISLPDLIHTASLKALDTVHADICVVAIREREHLRCFIAQREKLVPAAARTWEALDLHSAAPVEPSPRATLADEDAFTEIHAPLQGSLVADAIAQGRPLRDNAYGSADSLLTRVRATARVRVRHVLVIPFFVEDRCIGAIKLVNKRPDPAHPRLEEGFSDSDNKLLTLVAGQLAGPVAASLFRERQEKANRLSTIGQMLSGVIHDFKTPVTIISGYVQLMARQNDANIRKEYADSILKQFDQLNKMTKELLAFARGESSILLRRVFLYKFAEDLEELLGRELREKGIDLTIRADYRGGVKMDDAKMKRAVFNLARNALEAMPHGGAFTITMDRDGDEAVFRFTDTGPGIPEGIRASLFESFVTQGKEGGTGLGLAIVKKIVEEHSGSIDFDSGAGGTTFTVRIPLGDEQS